MAISHKQLQKEMGDAQMLIPEEEALLSWLNQQTDAVSLKDMEEQHAPGYDVDRVVNLTKNGLITKDLRINQDWFIAVYRISDDGRRELLMLQESRRKEAEKKRQQDLQNKLTIIAPFLTFFLGLLVEYFAGILELFSGLFQNIR